MIRKLVALKVAAAILLTSCAQTHKPANVPSTAGIRGDVTNTRDAIQKAQSSNTQAQGRSDAIGSNLDRAERKQVLIKRWFEINGK